MKFIFIGITLLHSMHAFTVDNGRYVDIQKCNIDFEIIARQNDDFFHTLLRIQSDNNLLKNENQSIAHLSSILNYENNKLLEKIHNLENKIIELENLKSIKIENSNSN
jgi:predicted nuclease with TOPRIM domain